MPGGPSMNLTRANVHVPKIERGIRVVKERSRALRHSLPYNRIPLIMTIWEILVIARMLNQFPTKNGISNTFSPKTIISGESLDYKNHLQIQFGQYCQVHEDHTPRNSEKEQTLGAISLGPSGKKQGGYYFMSLKTGSKVHRFSWDEFPMPDSMIKWVNTLSKDLPKHFIFIDRKGRLIGENELTGVDGETENPLQIEIVEDDDINQPDAVNEELAAQHTEEDQHQEADLGNEPMWS